MVAVAVVQRGQQRRAAWLAVQAARMAEELAEAESAQTQDSEEPVDSEESAQFTFSLIDI